MWDWACKIKTGVCVLARIRAANQNQKREEEKGHDAKKPSNGPHSTAAEQVTSKTPSTKSHEIISHIRENSCNRQGPMYDSQTFQIISWVVRVHNSRSREHALAQRSGIVGQTTTTSHTRFDLWMADTDLSSTQCKV